MNEEESFDHYFKYTLCSFSTNRLYYLLAIKEWMSQFP
jgi:hypothetical protein